MLRANFDLDFDVTQKVASMSFFSPLMVSLGVIFQITIDFQSLGLVWSSFSWLVAFFITWITISYQKFCNSYSLSYVIVNKNKNHS